MVFNGGVPVTQLVALALNADGQVELLSWFASVDVTIDVVGWNVAATGSWAYGYNPDGLRASKTPPAGSGIGATTFTWDRASGLPMLLAQTQAGVGATYWVYGPGGLPVEQINPDGTTLWLHHDQIGSTRLATDNAGAVVATWSFDPYGNQAAHSGTIDVPLGYTGQYTDPETGLQYLRARYYDPATATFLSRDPLNASTRSAYGYVYGDPLNATDPGGLCSAGAWIRSHLPFPGEAAPFSRTPCQMEDAISSDTGPSDTQARSVEDNLDARIGMAIDSANLLLRPTISVEVCAILCLGAVNTTDSSGTGHWRFYHGWGWLGAGANLGVPGSAPDEMTSSSYCEFWCLGIGTTGPSAGVGTPGLSFSRMTAFSDGSSCHTISEPDSRQAPFYARRVQPVIATAAA
jgi:RHS repeat-associated protein